MPNKEQLKEHLQKALDLNHDGVIDVKDLNEAIAIVSADGKITISDFISLGIKIISNMA